MNKDGMQLLNDYYDENSNFYQRAQPKLIANEFYADPNKLKNYIITLPMKHLKNSVIIYFLIESIHYMNDNKEYSTSASFLFNIFKNPILRQEEKLDTLFSISMRIIC